MRQPCCNTEHSVLLFLLYRGEKEAKRGTLLEVLGVPDSAESGSGRCPDTPPPFEKGGRKLLNCFATGPFCLLDFVGQNPMLVMNVDKDASQPHPTSLRSATFLSRGRLFLPSRHLRKPEFVASFILLFKIANYSID